MRAPRLLQRKRPGQHAASHAANAKAGRLLRGEDDQFNRAPRFKARALQRADGFKGTQHTHHAVVAPGIGNGVNMGTSRDWRQRSVLPGPARESIAHGVFPQLQPCLAA